MLSCRAARAASPGQALYAAPLFQAPWLRPRTGAMTLTKEEGDETGSDGKPGVTVFPRARPQAALLRSQKPGAAPGPVRGHHEDLGPLLAFLLPGFGSLATRGRGCVWGGWTQLGVRGWTKLGRGRAVSPAGGRQRQENQPRGPGEPQEDPCFVILSLSPILLPLLPAAIFSRGQQNPEF